MNKMLLIIAFTCLSFLGNGQERPKVFDVHLHGSNNLDTQLNVLHGSGVYKAAISTSWDLQANYRNKTEIKLLFGLMFPCPNGKVPYSLQPCYANGKDWPSLDWVEQQIKNGNIDFLGEVLSQYYGISSSDTLLYPYYALAEKYGIPVGIHTGGAGPDHGSPNFRLELGSPLLLENTIVRFPGLKVWIMHAGDHYFTEAITLMNKYRNVYADISVISNPQIVSAERFESIMRSLIEAGLEDRLMFGTDNADVDKVVKAVEALHFLSNLQKKKIFNQNAERFFSK